MEHLPDQALLTAADEHTAFSILYNRYWEQLYTKALQRLDNDADAQDCVQEIFISCWRNRQTIEVADSLAPYLFTALKYSIIKKVYKKSKKGIVFPLSVEALAKTTLSTDEFLEYKELQHLLSQEVNKLPEKMQMIYKLSRNEQLSVAEIANQLQVSEQTVKNTLTTALKRLRDKLSRYSSFLLLII